MLARIPCVAKDFNHKVSHHSNHKIINPTQILQRLQIALAQVKAGNKSETLINKTNHIFFVLSKRNNRMNTIFMNSGNSNKSDPH